MGKKSMVSIGPVAVDLVPISRFSKMNLSMEQRNWLWGLIGPLVDHCMGRQKLEDVLISVYLQGIENGAMAERARYADQ